MQIVKNCFHENLHEDKLLFEDKMCNEAITNFLNILIHRICDNSLLY